MAKPVFDLDTTKVELREALIDYWMATMQDKQIGPPERMKASENLAKYILSLGSTRVAAHRPPPRPPTADVLKLIQGMEDEEEDDAEESS